MTLLRSLRAAIEGLVSRDLKGVSVKLAGTLHLFSWNAVDRPDNVEYSSTLRIHDGCIGINLSPLVDRELKHQLTAASCSHSN